MKCPYCFTACDDKVLVCPNCSRDLVFFIPIAEEVSTLNQRVDVFVDRLRHLKLEVVRPVSKREEALSKVFDAAKVLLIYALQWVILKPLVEKSVPWELSLYWAYSLTALPYGAWLGFRRSSRGWAYFLIVGAALALVNYSLRGTLYQWTPKEASLFFISDILWFYTGSVLGSKVARWTGFTGASDKKVFTAAELMLNDGEPAREASSLNEYSERLKTYAAVLVPLLSIISTIIAKFWKE